MKDGEREADSMRECNAVESNLIWRRKEETKAAGAVGVQRRVGGRHFAKRLREAQIGSRAADVECRRRQRNGANGFRSAASNSKSRSLAFPSHMTAAAAANGQVGSANSEGGNERRTPTDEIEMESICDGVTSWEEVLLQSAARKQVLTHCNQLGLRR